MLQAVRPLTIFNMCYFLYSNAVVYPLHIVLSLCANEVFTQKVERIQTRTFLFAQESQCHGFFRASCFRR